MEKRKRRSFTKEYKAEVVELIRKSGKRWARRAFCWIRSGTSTTR